ncbi:MAG: hypothetical protein HKM23_09520 [Nitrosopumilus sp.]|nr:hypothetical protein [Nitrosopumilus sp.]NNL57957.1 hypothetical protein [Nitrosopumilus sp.]
MSDSLNESFPFVHYITLGGITFDETLIDQLLSDFTNITSQFEIEVSFAELLAYSIGMVIYGFFIWHFYRFLARREMIPLSLNKFQTNGRKAISVVGYIFKYVIVFPLVILVWFIVYSTFLFFMAPELSKEHVFLIVISLVVTVRISAYYREDLAKDFAKLIPFALLGIFLTSNIFFTSEDLVSKVYDFVPFLSQIIGFVVYAVIVETILRVLFLIKRKIRPAAEQKLEDSLEKQIDEKIKIHVEKIEDKTEDLEKKIENETNDIEKKIENNNKSLEKEKNEE